MVKPRTSVWWGFTNLGKSSVHLSCIKLFFLRACLFLVFFEKREKSFGCFEVLTVAKLKINRIREQQVAACMPGRL
jgi:hypothetical protein